MTSYLHFRSDKSYTATLDKLASVAVSGDDAEEFLSNQFSSDIKGLKPFQIQHSAWCDPKGRVLFLLQLCRVGDGFHCLVDSGLVEKFCQRLKMFVLRAAVNIAQRNDITAFAINLANKDVDALKNTINAGDGAYYYPFNESHHVDRCLRFAVAHELGDLIDSLNLPDDGDLWRRDEILLARPSVPPEASGAFLPQNLNLDALNGISFTKGCYPGQEIVARLKYRGKVKQRLCVLHAILSADDTTSPETLSAVTSSDGEMKKVGKTLASQIYENELFVSAVVNVEYFDSSEAFSIEGSEGSFSLLPPPYAIDS